MIQRLTIRGYRSIPGLDLRVGRLTVVCGPNGVGKTNVYNAVRLIGMAARGDLRRALSLEGGMPSIMWAGDPPLTPRRIELRVQFDDFGYALGLGLPAKTDLPPGDPRLSMFILDPLVKYEQVWAGPRPAKATLMFERKHTGALVRDERGRFVPLGGVLDAGESALPQLSDPRSCAELWLLRERLSRWRFYHHFDTSQRAAFRAPQVATQTPILADDGGDLAAALRTIEELGDAARLANAIESAFSDHALRIRDAGGCRLLIEMQRPGIGRWFQAGELSDGTLRYLCLAAALLSPRTPEFIALNEPETSLHHNLLAPLAKLIADAATRSQVWVTTHSPALADALAQAAARVIRLEVIEGRTCIEGQRESEALDPDAEDGEGIGIAPT